MAAQYVPALMKLILRLAPAHHACALRSQVRAFQHVAVICDRRGDAHGHAPLNAHTMAKYMRPSAQAKRRSTRTDEKS
eukprot:1256097-Pleurochrysis_carterae.AAC.3